MYTDVVLLLLAGLSCIGTPQVGRGSGVGGLATVLAGEAGSTGASILLTDTVFGSSFGSRCSIRLAFLGDWVTFLVRYRLKRIQRLSAVARFSQPAHGLIPIE